MEPNVVVFGQLARDLVLVVDQVPAAGRSGRVRRRREMLGGKGANQAVAAHRLGGVVTLVARVGQDGPGELALKGFAVEGLATDWITVDPAAPTGVALILVDRAGQNMIAVAPGANRNLTPTAIREAAPAFRPGGVVLVQLEIPLESVTVALELGRSQGMLTILNPAPAREVPDEVLRLADWLTPNESEAEALAGVRVVDAGGAQQAAKRLLGRGARQVVITRGDRGSLFAANGEIFELPAFPVAAVDTTAAGDAFTAALAVALARGTTPREALRQASAAGALATTRPGAQPALPTRAEVEAFLAGQPVAVREST